MNMSDNKKRKEKDEVVVEDVSFDGSGLNYDSDDLTESNYNDAKEKNGGGGVSSNANSTVTGLDQKWKKKGMRWWCLSEGV